MNESNLFDVCALLKSDKLRDRSDGLKRIQIILNQLKNDSNTGIWNDKVICSLLGGLFTAVSKEKSAFIRSKKTSSGPTAFNRLREAGKVVRFALKSFLENMKTRSVRLTVQHFLDILPQAGEFASLCEPISNDYLKSLKMLCSYSIHLEHLTEPLWQSLVKFYSSLIQRLLDTPSQQNYSAGGKRNSLYMDTQPGSFTQLSVYAGEIFHPLNRILSVPWAPVHKVKSDIYHPLIVSLQIQQQVEFPVLHLILSCLNTLLTKVYSQDVRFSACLIRDTLGPISNLWYTKSSSSREQLLSFVFLSMPFIQACLSDNPIELLLQSGIDIPANTSPTLIDSQNIFNFLITLKNEYMQRPAKDRLSLDDLYFSTTTKEYDFFGTHRYHIREQGNMEAWFTVRLISKIESSVYTHKAATDSCPDPCRTQDLNDTHEDRSSPYPRFSSSLRWRKQPRLSRDDGEDPLDNSELEYMKVPSSNGALFDFLNSISISDDSTLILHLQVLSFLLSDGLAPLENEICPLLRSLSGLCTNDKPLISSWAFICVGCLDIKNIHSSTSSEKIIREIARTAIRCLPSYYKYRAASFTLSRILDDTKLSFYELSNCSDSANFLNDANSPRFVCDTSLMLCNSILKDAGKVTHFSGHVELVNESVLSWFSSRFTIESVLATTQSMHIASMLTVDDLKKFLLGLCFHPCKNTDTICSYHGVLMDTVLVMQDLSGSIDFLLLPDKQWQRAHQQSFTEDKEVERTLNSKSASENLEKSLLAHMQGLLDCLVEEINQGLHPAKHQLAFATSILYLIISSGIVIDNIAVKESALVSPEIRRISNTLCEALRLAEQHILPILYNEPQKKTLTLLMSSVIPNDPISDDSFGSLSVTIFRTISIALNDAIVLENRPITISFAELDDSFDEQPPLRSRNIDDVTTFWPFGYTYFQFICSYLYIRNTMLMNMAMICDYHKCQKDPVEYSETLLPSYITSLDPQRLLASLPSLVIASKFLNDQLRNDKDNNFSGSGWQKILECLARRLCQQYDSERSDVLYFFLTELLLSWIDMWVAPRNRASKRVSEDMMDIYVWLRQVIVDKLLSSPICEATFANLLIRILSIDNNFGRSTGNPDVLNDNDTPSASASFCTLLKNSSIQVKYHMIGMIPKLFAFFPEKHHSLLYKDVLQLLEADDSHWEPLAIRILCLANISISSPGVLRTSIYDLVEMTRFKSVSLHLKTTMASLSIHFNLTSPKDILSALSRQLFHSWISYKKNVYDFPYQLFGINTYESFFLEHYSELIAQLICSRGENGYKEAEILANTYHIPQAIKHSFHQTYAYSLLWDLRRSENNHVVKIAEILESRLGARVLKDWTRDMSAHILGSLISCCNVKVLKQVPLLSSGLLKQADTMEESLKEYGPLINLEVGMQPSFSIERVLSAIEKLKSVIGGDSDIYSQENIILIMRSFFDRAELVRNLGLATSELRHCFLLQCLGYQKDSTYNSYLIRLLVRTTCQYLEMDQHSSGYSAKITNSENYQTEVYCILHFLFKHEKSIMLKDKQLLAFSLLTVKKALLRRRMDASTPKDTVSSRFIHWFSGFVSVCNKESELTCIAPLLECNSTEPIVSHQDCSNAILTIICQSTILDANTKTIALEIFDLYLNQMQTSRIRDMQLYTNTLKNHPISILKKLRPLHKSFSNSFYLWASKIAGTAYMRTGNADILEEEVSDLALYSPKRTPESYIYGVTYKVLDTSNSKEAGLTEQCLRMYHFGMPLSAISSQLALALPVDKFQFSRALSYPAYGTTLKIIQQSLDSVPQKIVDPLKTTFLDWVKQFSLLLCCHLCNLKTNTYIGTYILIDQVPSLAPQLFPYLLLERLIVMESTSQSQNEEFSKQLELAFNSVFTNYTGVLYEHANLLIRTFLFLRSFPRKREGHAEMNRFMSNFWIGNLNFIAAAGAAKDCEKYKTAILLSEIEWTIDDNSAPILKSAMLREVYERIDDPDVIYGVEIEPTVESTMRLFQHEGDAWKSLTYESALYDALVSESSLSREPNSLLHSVYGMGFDGLYYSNARLVDTNTLESAGYNQDLYSSAWNLQQWDLPVPSEPEQKHDVLYTIFHALNCSKDPKDVFDTIDSSSTRVLSNCLLKKKSPAALKCGLETLGIISRLRELLDAVLNDPQLAIQSFTSLHDDWAPTGFDEIFRAQTTTLSILHKKLEDKTSFISNHPGLKDMSACLTLTMKTACEVARQQGEYQRALVYAMKMQQVAKTLLLQPLKDIAFVNADLQSARVLWSRTEFHQAIRMMKKVLKQSYKMTLSKSVSTLSVPDGLAIKVPAILTELGRWINLARQESPEQIMNNYLLPAVKGLETSNFTAEERGLVFHDFAHFCDRQTKNASADEYFVKISKMKSQKEEEIEELERMLKSPEVSTHDRTHAKRLLGKVKLLRESDCSEYRRLLNSRKQYLEYASQNYLLCLSNSDEHDEDVYRFCSLWFAHALDDVVNKTIKMNIGHVPTYKFVPWINQLSSRLSSSDSLFQDILSHLVQSMCEKHPFHTLLQLISLRNNFTSSKGVAGGNEAETNLRAAAAQRVWEALLADPGYTKTILQPLDKFCKKAVLIAQRRVNNEQRAAMKKSGGHFRIADITPADTNFWLKSLPKLRVVSPTMNIPLRKDCDYSSAPYIYAIFDRVDLASGISQPKVLSYSASDGKCYKALMKSGNDDLRQDAIMEQVFDQVNVFFKKDKATRQRQLSVRTYKVVPLGPTVGMIEFVMNTMALIQYLDPAHVRYHPKDWTVRSARRKIEEVQPLSVEKRIEAYEEVTKHIHPVLRHFFFERFYSPDEWFQKRSRYTQSTAAISILGSVLGLGDRHCNNILLDTSSGEPIHIDLGVAFEQGKLLAIPESVPFRLSRDIVDGMGITKTEGIFRRCCEFTLDVLRHESTNIMGILDVLKYDPLYSWKISPLRKRKLQDDAASTSLNQTLAEEKRLRRPPSSKSNNNMLPTTTLTMTADGEADNSSEAERCLMVVAQKLKPNLSVQATVNELIQEASDTKNLALLYFGWNSFY